MNFENRTGSLNRIDRGRSGLRVTERGFSGIPIMRFGTDEVAEIFRQGFELGIRFFDTHRG